MSSYTSGRGSASRPGHPSFEPAQYLDVSILVQQHVVQLQIAVDDATRVQEEKTDGNLGGVEPGSKERPSE